MKLLVERNRLIFKPEVPHDHFMLGVISCAVVPCLVNIVNDTDNPNPTVIALEIKTEDLIAFLLT